MATLVAQGLTNREIATRLFISERTAESHVEQIRGKLGFHSRVQIANWVAADLPDNGGPVAGVPAAASAQPQSRPRLRRRFAVAISAVVVGAALVAGLAFASTRLPAPTAAGPRAVIVAGTGERAFSGDGRQASSSALVRPLALAIGPAGEIYIAETGFARSRRTVESPRSPAQARQGTAVTMA